MGRTAQDSNGDREGRTSRALRTIGKVNRTLVRATDEAGLLREICRIIVKDCGYRLSWIGYALEDRERSIVPVAQYGYDEGYVEGLKLSWDENRRGRGPAGTAVRTRQPAACQDVQKDPDFKPWRAQALRRGYASVICLPLKHQDKAFGVLCIYSQEPDSFDAEESALLLQMAEDLAFGITALRGEEQRQHLLAALGRSELRYRQMMDSTGTAICILDERGCITFGNEEFKHILQPGACGNGEAGSESSCSWPGFLDRVEEEDRERVARAMLSLLQGEESGPVSLECRLRDRNGNLLHFLLAMNRLADSRNLVVSLVDISWEKYYAASLQENAERLRDFINIASHELRHPITIIGGYASLLTEGLDQIAPDRLPTIMRSIVTATRRLKHVVDQLLDISRIEQGRFSLERRLTDIAPLVRQAVDEIKLRGFGQTYRVSCAPGLGPVQVDAERFLQLMIILLENACKFSPADSVISVSMRLRGDALLVSVADRGPGIPHDARHRVFERFFEVEGSAHHSLPGLGVGLSIAQQIVKGHGGDIWCEPRRGGGTVFRFTLVPGTEMKS
jgi:signal transduction histidine kinase/putative methionine-R-sulfoxide reductase with GAF domain